MKLGRGSGKQTYGDQEIRGEGGINQELGTDIYIQLFIKQITNEDLLCSTGNSVTLNALYGKRT